MPQFYHIVCRFHSKIALLVAIVLTKNDRKFNFAGRRRKIFVAAFATTRLNSFASQCAMKSADQDLPPHFF